MIFSDTEMMELDIRHTTNIHNTRSLIRTLKYVLEILQTEEAFTVEEYKYIHTHTENASKIRETTSGTQVKTLRALKLKSKRFLKPMLNVENSDNLLF